MKTLVAYYSRSGHTKQVAKAIAEQLNADLEEINDLKNRSGFFGFIIAGFDGTFKKPTQIKEIEKDPAQYDLVIMGSPIWGFVNSAPALRTYVSQNKDKFKKVAFFLTMGGSPGKSAVADLEKVCGKKSLAMLEITEDQIGKGTQAQKVDQFIALL